MLRCNAFKLILLLLSSSVYFQAGKIDPLINMMLGSGGSPSRAISASPASKVTMEGGEPRIEVLIKTENGPGEISKIKGLKINSVVQSIVTASIPLSSINELAKLANIKYIEASRKVKLKLDASLSYAGIADINNTYRYKGSGVLVGIVDSGIDFTSKDFCNIDGTTRIKSIWDQTAVPSASFANPAGYSYGVEYNQTALNASLSGGVKVPQTDTIGHGSHVAGIASGNGLATGNLKPSGVYTGAASEADIIVVKTSLYTSTILDGVKYIINMAAALKMPVVINLSIGTQDSPHDGTLVFETALDNLTGAGKIIVVSAGNEGAAKDGKIHFSGTATATSTITVNALSRAFALFSMWYKGGDNISVQVKHGSNYYPALPVTAGGSFLTNTSEGRILIDATEYPSVLNNDNNVIIALDNSTGTSVATGTWELILKGESIPFGGVYDIWATDAGYCNFQDGDTEKTVAAPGTGKKIITAGSFVSKTAWTDVNNNSRSVTGETIGSASSFSSSGPTRDNRKKPDILAPGQMIGSTISKDVYGNDTSKILPDNKHILYAGTSMSAPHVTGLVALLLQKNGNLGTEEVRTALTSTASGLVWNKKDGYGRINGLAAFLSVASFVPPAEALAVTEAFSYPNPAKGKYVNFVYRINRDNATEINFYNLTGSKVSSAANFSTSGLNKYSYDVSKIAPGIYFCQITADGGAIKSKTMKVAIIK